MIELQITDQEGHLIRQLIDMGLKQGGLPAARQLLALDDKLVIAAQKYEAELKKNEPVIVDKRKPHNLSKEDGGKTRSPN